MTIQNNIFTKHGLTYEEELCARMDGVKLHGDWSSPKWPILCRVGR